MSAGLVMVLRKDKEKGIGIWVFSEILPILLELVTRQHKDKGGRFI